MKILIAIMSCVHDQDTHQASRDTWLIGSPVDHKFFMGRGAIARSDDEIVVDENDDYEHVTEKSRAIFGYALANAYDFVLHCGRDTFINPLRLLNSGLHKRHYAGHRTSGGLYPHYVELIAAPQGWYEYASGGAGSWLSAWAMNEILKSPLYHVADDLMYGWILGGLGVPLYHDPRFLKWGTKLRPGDISVHLSRKTGVYEKEWMYRAHRLSR